ncbi:MAG: oxidoreductase [Lentisphaerae bacterium]|nr:oxidoreductase [Lentisphaerota bacterium]
MSRKLNWGIISTGAIARAFADGLAQSKTGQLAGVASRNAGKALAFGQRHGLDAAACHGSYDALLSDPSVEAVYVATPHPLHAEWSIRAAEAGKHVLCEKPFAVNAWEASAMLDAARENGTFMMEAFMYRCHPQVAKLLELLRSGAIGEIRSVQASFAFRAGWNPDSRLLSNALAGGGILDVGCYPVSFARLVAGAACGADFDDPVELQAVGVVGETRVDEAAMAVMKFRNGFIAEVAAGVRLQMENVARVYGTDGWILMKNPWGASREKPETGRMVLNAGGKVTEFEVAVERTSFAYEADAAAEAIFAGRREPAAPAMTWNDTLGNMNTLDLWRARIRLEYDCEKPGGRKNTAAGRPLRVKSRAAMKYGSIPGVLRRVSRLIFGCDNQVSYPHARSVFDAWYECGGNAFDTAWLYGGGSQEKLLGEWMSDRGVRNEVVVAVKGAATPRCTPEFLLQDFAVSLDRLKLDRADIYIMHRDNRDVPIGEFVDTLDSLKKRGLIGAWGGSNWSIERFEAAAAYAKAHGREGPAILNNNLSLARMVIPVWPGCIHVSDPESRAWLERTQTVHFSWSSQARGYFLGDSEWKKLGQQNFEAWDAEDNRERRKRAFELAERKGCSAVNIALAYVLAQPFPSFALIGPRDVRELRTSLPGLDVELTQAERKYLNLEADRL